MSLNCSNSIQRCFFIINEKKEKWRVLVNYSKENIYFCLGLNHVMYTVDTYIHEESYYSGGINSVLIYIIQQ